MLYFTCGVLYQLWGAVVSDGLDLPHFFVLLFIDLLTIISFSWGNSLIFLTTLVPNADRLFILGDFNIHVCCPDKPLVSEFLHIIDSFNLSQSMIGATHEKGHTLDLILSFGFTLQIVQIEDCCFSDHKPILFNTVLSFPVKQPSPSFYIRPLNSDYRSYPHDSPTPLFLLNSINLLNYLLLIWALRS